MKTMTVRNVPDSIYKQLTEWACANNRSLQEQVRHLLVQEVKLHKPSALEAAAAARKRLKGRALGNVVVDIREDREQ